MDELVITEVKVTQDRSQETFRQLPVDVTVPSLPYF